MVKIKKIPKQYRLDFNMVGFVEAIASKKGITETKVIEMAINKLAMDELTLKEKEEIMVEKFREMMSLGEEEN